MSWGCALLILGSKGKMSRSQYIDNWKWFMPHICFPFTAYIRKLHKKTSLELQMRPFYFGGNRLRLQCINSWKWFMSQYCYPFTPTHHKPSHSLSWGCALLISGSKGQSWRSRCIDYWKGVLSHICFPIYIKLRTPIPSEYRICPNDNVVKTWRVWIGWRGGYLIRQDSSILVIFKKGYNSY